MTAAVRVFLVDDHEIVRRGLAELIGSQTGIEIVGEAATVAQARTRIAATSPDVVLLDVRLPDGSGIDVCRWVLTTVPGVRCIMLTAYDDEGALAAAVLAGASGYVLKDIRGTALIDAVRTVGAGGTLLTPTLRRAVSRQLSEHAVTDPRLNELTRREAQILTLIAEGLTNRQIGSQIGLAEKTVKNYVSNLLAKLGLESRTQAAMLQRDLRG